MEKMEKRPSIKDYSRTLHNMLLERIRSLFMEIMEIREISVSDFSLNFFPYLRALLAFYGDYGLKNDIQIKNKNNKKKVLY